jgi:KUP system potassium uptake protein
MSDVRPPLLRPALTFGALGIVFGDIGTSPLYTIIEVFHGANHGGLQPSHDNVIGVVSLIVWSVILIVTVKYVAFVMRADNDGEGGILALLSLAVPRAAATAGGFLVFAGLAGAALLYGDGVITPAISVLSAVEGTKVVSSSMSDFVVPISVAILLVLFAVQRFGTARIGRVFAPVMLGWFVTIGVLGAVHLVQDPQILAALNPFSGAQFFVRNGREGFLALGAVCLSITGGEALYADMGHFGARPIRLAWHGVVLPSLLLCYLGQGASLLGHPDRFDSSFFKMAPHVLLIPLVLLATAATIIASQALISGAFSMTAQAAKLGYIPRVNIVHTSEGSRGQIYVPVVNHALCVGCIALVIGFGSATALAGAYGLAVTATMVVTTVLFYRVARTRFGWSTPRAAALCGFFSVIDVAFLSANIPKIPHGGWFPLSVCVLLMVVFTTWKRGRALVRERLGTTETTIEDFALGLRRTPDLVRTPGLGIYLGANPLLAPQALRTHLRAARSLPEQICIVNVVTEPFPHVASDEIIRFETFPSGVSHVLVRSGFMDDPQLAPKLETIGTAACGIDFANGEYVLGRETVLVTDRPGMAKWRERLFRSMLRNSMTADVWFGLPPERTIELGTRVEL